MSLQRKGSIDPAEYSHLTHKERMIAGYPYDSFDEELMRDQATANKLFEEYNSTDVKDAVRQRAVLAKLFNPECRERKCFIDRGLRVRFGYNITHGENFYANFDCIILDCAPVTIGDNVMLAPGVHIYTAGHPLEAEHRQITITSPVKIGNNVWIGGKAIICPGVVIGDNAVIGAGAVVVKDVPANTVVAGNPARVIRGIENKSSS